VNLTDKQKREAFWAEAKRRCRLDDDELGMARELGLSPRSLMKGVPGCNPPRKVPVGQWIRNVYEESQAKDAAAKTAQA
jgi:hypothetical protein